MAFEERYCYPLLNAHLDLCHFCDYLPVTRYLDGQMPRYIIYVNRYTSCKYVFILFEVKVAQFLSNFVEERPLDVEVVFPPVCLSQAL